MRTLKADVFSVIPQHYSHLHPIEKIREYLSNTRATNLREAIEIYELELYREQEIAIQTTALASA